MPRMLRTELRSEMPGLRGNVAINNMRFKLRPADYVLKLARVNGVEPGVAAITKGNASLVVLFGREAVRSYYTDRDQFERIDGGPLLLPAGHEWSAMTASILTATGADHSARRRRIGSAFRLTSKACAQEEFQRTFQSSRLATHGEYQSFDMVSELQWIAKANMLKLILGLPVNNANMKLAADVSALLTDMLRPSILGFRLNSVITPYGWWLGRVSDVYRELIGIISERRLDPVGNSVLSMLCRQAQVEQISDGEIAGEIVGLFTAGHDTTASAMTWTLFAYLADQNLWDAAPRDVMREAQRFFPTVPVSIPRRLVRDVTIGTISLPKGAAVSVSSLIEHKRRDNFPDPNVFNPMRWTHDEPAPFTYFPFAVGRWRCAAAAFAEAQVLETLKLIISRRWQFELLSDRVDYHVDSSFISRPRNPILIRANSNSARPRKLFGNCVDLWPGINAR